MISAVVAAGTMHASSDHSKGSHPEVFSMQERSKYSDMSCLIECTEGMSR